MKKRDEKRDEVIQIRLTKREKADILRKAKKCKMSASSYMRQLASGHNPKEYPSQLFSLCFEIEQMTYDFKGKDDEKFKNYLVSYLKDLRKFLYLKDGDNNGNNQNLAH